MIINIEILSLEFFLSIENDQKAVLTSYFPWNIFANISRNEMRMKMFVNAVYKFLSNLIRMVK